MLTLMYHRISLPDSNPWGVCVSPEHFEEQIAWLTENFTVIDPATLHLQFRERRIDPNSILITFDDGYKDNFTTAIPILQKYDCPAIFFIPTRFIGSNHSFWWDELETIFLHSPTLPPNLELFIAGELIRFTISNATLSPNDLALHYRWRWYEEAPTDRCAIFLAIWKLMLPLPGEEIASVIKMLRDWSHQAAADISPRPLMTLSELQELAACPGVDIGLHTHNHPDLAGKPDHVQKAEIIRSGEKLKEYTNVESKWLAYPYGKYDTTTLQIVSELNLDLCFTTSQTEISPETSRFEIGRIQAPDLPLDEFKQMIFR